jgi:hypothetical protein
MWLKFWTGVMTKTSKRWTWRDKVMTDNQGAKGPAIWQDTLKWSNRGRQYFHWVFAATHWLPLTKSATSFLALIPLPYKSTKIYPVKWVESASLTDTYEDSMSLFLVSATVGRIDTSTRIAWSVTGRTSDYISFDKQSQKICSSFFIILVSQLSLMNRKTSFPDKLQWDWGRGITTYHTTLYIHCRCSRSIDNVQTLDHADTQTSAPYLCWLQPQDQHTSPSSS